VVQSFLELGWTVDRDTGGQSDLAFTVETSLAYFHGCCTLTSWGPLHILILSVWGLKEIGVWNYLPLWGDKSLSS
jgi:hypothetical protein